jgi:hypothetical protein
VERLHADNRPEYLLAHHFHGAIRARQHCRLDEIALIAMKLAARGAFGAPSLKEAFHALMRLLGD